jgi:protein ImuB
MSAVRTLVVWCPDWPVLAAGHPLAEPVLVLHTGRVVACSPAARAHGVTIGLRRRDAQARCPHAATIEHDPPTEARRFEAVLAAVEAFTPRLEVVQPGACSLATRGPSRYFGGDEPLAARLGAAVDEVLAGSDTTAGCRIGVADGPFAASLAARHERSRPTPLVVAPGGSPAFLAPLPLSALADGTAERDDLVSVLARLGLHTLGDLAALPLGSVVGRFGAAGEGVHRLASGLEERPLHLTTPPPDLAAVAEIDPPAEQVEPVAFRARALADDLHERLGAMGLSCTRVLVAAETEHGEQHERLWRHEGALTPAAMADRVRWQLDGWLQGPIRRRPTAGITRLVLAPDEVVAATGRQLGFWGGETEAAERVGRALARLEGMVGAAAVTVPERAGGRDPAEQVVRVAAGTVDLVTRAESFVGDGLGSRGELPVRAMTAGAPWPGRVPAAAPAVLHRPPRPAEVVDPDGRPVTVDGRGRASGAPARLSVEGRRGVDVEAGAGPWPADERWWDEARHRRQARFQVVTASGAAHLLALDGGRWWCTATYD